MNDLPRFRRPVAMASLEGLNSEADPATQSEIAHATAALLLQRGRAHPDREAVRRFVTLADEVGLEVIADMWAKTPEVSLPGSLWRLYVLREWIHRSPSAAANDFQTGMGSHQVAEIVAGVENPPGPDSVRVAADAILAGVFTGDFAVALERAAAFARIVALGRSQGDSHASATSLNATADALLRSAAAWRSGHLD